MPPHPITQQVQLLVEGRSPHLFFGQLLRHLGRTDVQLQDFRGVTDLRAFLRALVRTPEFESVRSLAVIRDAENHANGAFQSATDALDAAGLPRPPMPIQPSPGPPVTRVFILPDCAAPGMLENLCLASVGADPAMQCVRRYFDCLEDSGLVLDPRRAKTEVLAFLASRPQFVEQVGRAAQVGIWPWGHAAFAAIQQSLRDL